MKKSILISFSFVISMFAIGQNEKPCTPIVQAISTANTKTDIRIDLDVFSACDFSMYPSVIAYYNGVPVNKPIKQRYAHMAETNQKYSLNIPYRYEDKIHEFVYKLTGFVDSEGPVQMKVDKTAFHEYRGEKGCLPVLKALKTAENENGLELKLDVHTDCNFHNYPSVIVYLDGQPLNKPTINVYAQAAGSTQTYSVIIAKKHKEDIDRLSFKLSGSEDGELKDIQVKKKKKQERKRPVAHARRDAPVESNNVAEVQRKGQITSLVNEEDKGFQVLELDVLSHMKISNNVRVIAYQNGKEISELVNRGFFVHPAGKIFKYKIRIPLDVDMTQLTFKLVGIDNQCDLEIALD